MSEHGTEAEPESESAAPARSFGSCLRRIVLVLGGGLVLYGLWRMLPVILLFGAFLFGCMPSPQDHFVNDTTYVPPVNESPVDTAPVLGIKAPVEEVEAPVEDFEAPVVDAP
ncbi:hypothetical protein [Nocardiopsis sp. CC223A]|uniref:hypothetical protein n=1 Tax=Nocardiopsis sp. CC223A TaxID=3044051 RepID=UPI00278C1790|nr:hypothetical protein [Nocardiopsis sp. CC223A]